MKRAYIIIHPFFRLSNLQVVLTLFPCPYFIFAPFVITSRAKRRSYFADTAVVSAPVSHSASLTLNIFINRIYSEIFSGSLSPIRHMSRVYDALNRQNFLLSPVF
jgi:hypothetical protein